ncbi:MULTISPECIES: cobalamin B12-binding domain-containing protein [unclassified Yoonia]|uniref:cobalamin B12-binding domain-containing protein n=1 Tax=unclassified Yoonia TaxID=2629118 RepID=UPI002AFE941C|nr:MULTISPECIES: cobalamin-dependent protein [unclassified Yoonia]
MADRHNIDVMGDKGSTKRPKGSPRSAVGLTLVPSVDRQLDDNILGTMRAAALGADRENCTSVLDRALAAGIARDDIADFYIPELAREMGVDWCEDTLSFASVTIGVSRLQAMLRALGPEWAGDQSANPAAPSIMLIVGQDVYHTLGAMVLGGQLRRKGLSVRLMLGAQNHELAEKLAKTRYDAVFISSSLGETLESLRRIVDVVRKSCKTSLPVVIGGTILETETLYDVMSLTGADYATSFPNEALELCGLTTKYLKIAPNLREV